MARKKEDNVKEYEEIKSSEAVAIKAQMDKDFTLRTLDEGKTTDEHIFNIAVKKENIINKFYANVFVIFFV